MRAHTEQGLETQIDSSVSRVRSPEPMTKLEAIANQVDNTCTVEEVHRELVDDVVSQAMLRVIQRVSRAQGGSRNHRTIVERLHTNRSELFRAMLR